MEILIVLLQYIWSFFYTVCRAVAQKEVDNLFFTWDSDLDNLAIKNIGSLNPIELLYKFLIVKFVKQLPLLESRKIKDSSILENITDKDIKDAWLWDNFLEFIDNYFS